MYSFHLVLPTIAPNSFKDCTNLSAIYGYVGSYAETFAAENNYQFVGFQEPYEDVTLMTGSFGCGIHV